MFTVYTDSKACRIPRMHYRNNEKAKIMLLYKLKRNNHCKITNYSYDRNRAVTNSTRVRKDDELIIHL